MPLSDFKRGFFDQERVLRAVGQATRKAFSKYGAYVRTRARTSIRKRAGTSAPGSPPHSHEGALRSGIYFAYDQSTRSVVVGPALLNGRPRAGATVPEALEYGGPLLVRRGRGRPPERVHIRPRPFMRPAAAAERRLLSDLLRDRVGADGNPLG